jgi:hypothetical protein
MNKHGEVICENNRKCNVTYGTGPDECPHKRAHYPICTEPKSKHRKATKFCNDKGGLCCYIDEETKCA